MVCSVDCRKVISRYDINPFYVEMMLEYAYPKIVINLIKKFGSDDKSVKKIIAMLRNGYVKFNRNISGKIQWDKIDIVYYTLCNYYLDTDFRYDDIILMNDMNVDPVILMSIIRSINVKHIRYIHKILTMHDYTNNTIHVSELPYQLLDNSVGNVKYNIDRFRKYAAV